MYDESVTRLFYDLFGMKPTNTNRKPIDACKCEGDCGSDCECGCHPAKEPYFPDVFKSINKPLPMKTDAYIKDGSINLDIDLPGFDKKDIKISFKDKALIVSASKDTKKNVEEETEKTEKVKEIFSERSRVACSRSFHVNGNYEIADFNATYENGVLHVTFPAEKEVDTKDTEIKIN